MKFLLISARVLCSISPLYLLSSSLEDLSKLPCHDNTLILEENNFDFISELNAKNVQVIPRVELNQSVYSKYTSNCKATKFSGSLSELKQKMQDEYFIIASLPFEQEFHAVQATQVPYSKRTLFEKYTFFSPAIFMGIFTMILTLSIASCGAMMIFNLQTPDRFEMPIKK